jgi:hypothetical protein
MSAQLVPFSAQRTFEELIDQQGTEGAGVFLGEVIALGEVNKEDFPFIHDLAEVYGTARQTHKPTQGLRGKKLEQAVLGRQSFVAPLFRFEHLQFSPFFLN